MHIQIHTRYWRHQAETRPVIVLRNKTAQTGLVHALCLSAKLHLSVRREPHSEVSLPKHLVPAALCSKGLGYHFCHTVTHSDVIVIASQRNTDINLMLTNYIKSTASTGWLRKLWVAAFFIFQGPTESLMLYADALHCNYRSHWSRLTVLPFMYKIMLFYTNHKPGVSTNMIEGHNTISKLWTQHIWYIRMCT